MASLISYARRGAALSDAREQHPGISSSVGKISLLLFEKLLDGCDRQGGVFLVEHMPEVAEDDKLTSRNVAIKSLTTLRQMHIQSEFPN
jgi:hypothetical protein